MQGSIESILITAVALLFGVAVLTTAARRFQLPYPSLLVLGGLGLSFVPGVPSAALDPRLVLLVFLPPLVFSAGWATSWRDVRRNRTNLLWLAVGLVLATTLGVAVALHLVAPAIPWGACFALGAIVSPTDPIAANAMASKLGLPHRLVSLLESESLANDATGLVAYRFAVAAVLAGTFSIGKGAIAMVAVSVGGALIGGLGGLAGTLVMARIDDASIEIALQLITGYATYLIAEGVGASGVFAAAAAGLFVGLRSFSAMGSRTRLRATAFWETLVYLINGVLFLLLGLQLRQILQASDLRLADMMEACAAAIVATVLIRFAWIAAFVRKANQVPLGRGERIVLGWAGMRGVLSVATALALPLALPGGEPFPARPILVLAAFSVVVATLVVQGLSLPALIKRLGLASDDGFDAEEQGARLVALQAASARLAELTRAASGAEAEAARELERRLQMALSRAGDGLGPASVSREFDAAFSVLQRQIIEAERGALLQLWRAGQIDDHSLRRIERDLDLRELRL